MPRKRKDPEGVQRRRQGDIVGDAALLRHMYAALGGIDAVKERARKESESRRVRLQVMASPDGQRRLVLINRAPNIIDLLRDGGNRLQMFSARHAYRVKAGQALLALTSTEMLKDDDLVLLTSQPLDAPASTTFLNPSTMVDPWAIGQGKTPPQAESFGNGDSFTDDEEEEEEEQEDHDVEDDKFEDEQDHLPAAVPATSRSKASQQDAEEEEEAEEEAVEDEEVLAKPKAQTAAGINPADQLSKARGLWQARESRYWAASQAREDASAVPWVPPSKDPLPVDEYRAEILQASSRNRVVIVSGATGCGKSTRIPQFLLEANASASVVVCEPRRIAAISLAKRVASELGEEPGHTCGYAVRLETAMSRSTRLLYCTSGVLLRRLAWDPTLAGSTHVVVDEAHERSLMSDMCLLALKNLLHGPRPDLHCIVLSATMDPNLFKNYFAVDDSCIVTIPNAERFPIETLFLEDALALTNYVMPHDLETVLSGPSEEAEYDLDTFEPNVLTPNVSAALQTMAPGDIHLELLERLIVSITSAEGSAPLDGGHTAILIFVSGLMAMTSIIEYLGSKLPMNKFVLLPLHSQLAMEEQAVVFFRPPSGVTKIVVATNIAETSVTIEDVGYVIDTCLVREASYDFEHRMPSLSETFVSRSSARQRRGRCGRTAPGVCIHLVTKPFFDSELSEYSEPESTRCNLEEAILHVKLLHASEGVAEAGGGSAPDYFASLVSPPAEEHVKQTMSDLLEMGALVSVGCASPDTTILSPLGFHLAALPCELRHGKMLILACVFGVVDHILTIVSSLGSHNAFLMPFNKKVAGMAKAARKRFGKSSDGLAAVNMRAAWLTCKRAGVEKDFARDHFVSLTALQQNERQRQVLGLALQSAGMLSSSVPWSEAVTKASFNSKDTALVRSILCAGQFPNVAKVMPTSNMACGPCCGEDKEPLPCVVGSQSILSGETAKLTWVVYGDRLYSKKSSRLALRDVTACPPMALLCFGDQFIIDRSKKSRDGLTTMRVGNWICIRAKPKVATLIAGVRRSLDAYLADFYVNGSPIGEAVDAKAAKKQEEVRDLVIRVCKMSDNVAVWENDLA